MVKTAQRTHGGMIGHGDFSNFTLSELSRIRGNLKGSFEIRDFRESTRRNINNEKGGYPHEGRRKGTF